MHRLLLAKGFVLGCERLGRGIIFGSVFRRPLYQPNISSVHPSIHHHSIHSLYITLQKIGLRIPRLHLKSCNFLTMQLITALKLPFLLLKTRKLHCMAQRQPAYWIPLTPYDRSIRWCLCYSSWSCIAPKTMELPGELEIQCGTVSKCLWPISNREVRCPSSALHPWHC